MSLTLAEAWAQTAGKGTIAERIALVRGMTVLEDAPIPLAAVRKLWAEEGVLGRAWVVANSDSYSFAERWHCRAAYDALMNGIYNDFDARTQGARLTVQFQRLMAAGPDGDKVLTPEIVAATLALGKRAVPAFAPSQVDYEPLLAAGLIAKSDTPTMED